MLFRQVGNLKRKKLSLRKENRSLKLRMKVGNSDKGKLELLVKVAQI